MKARWLMAVGLAAAAVSCGQPAAPPASRLLEEVKARIHEIQPQELRAWRADGQPLALIDVREDHEWKAGHASGARHISRWRLEERIGAEVPEKPARIVLYCLGGVRSALAADKLQKLGYTRVYSLAGGFRAYQAAGLPVEQ